MIDDIEFVRTVAVARITMPRSMVRLSAGRESMSEATQALCFLAGANSIFTGDKLLTTANAGDSADAALLAKLGMRPMVGEEPMRAEPRRGGRGRMIGSLLIANRGEIACRIIRTARAMGIRTVAVYSDADAKALHVRQADEAVHIGPSPARESYLVGDKIIAAAKASGAEAIHPGYGFLSENADFAQAVIDAGLVWVGPKPDSIRAMGLKDAAKALMTAAGVPVTPGYMGDNQDAGRSWPSKRRRSVIRC